MTKRIRKMGNNFKKIAQKYTILMPQQQDAYTISVKEWRFLIQKIKSIGSNSNFFNTIGSILIGASISALITALIGIFSTDQGKIICWTATVVTGAIGILCYIFSAKEEKIQKQRKEDTIEIMELIEEKYEQKKIV